MREVNQTVQSGGGAVFAGDVTAGRDVVINHVTEIRQTTEELYSRCSASAGGREDLLGRLDNLQWIAEIVEDQAKRLQPDISADNTQLQRVHRECGSVLSDIRSLAAQIQDTSSSSSSKNVAHETWQADFSLSGKCDKVREKLMTLQMVLSHIRNDRTAQDAHDIKVAVIQQLNNPTNTDDASSCRTFYTASSIPYVDKQAWQELQRSLRGQFSAEYVRDNFALIISTMEEMLSEHVDSALETDMGTHHKLSESEHTQPSGRHLSSSESAKSGHEIDRSIRHHETPDPRQDMVDSLLEKDDQNVSFNSGRRTESMSPEPGSPKPWDKYERDSADKSGATWAGRDEPEGEHLVTFDGGGVKAWSSLLIVEGLMLEIARCENKFEAAFTHYPRHFDISDLRPCHYFDKMYGTSTGGIIAIALGRLRMTVAQTTGTLRQLLGAMYSSRRSLLSLTTKYHHKPFEAALVKVVNECYKNEQTVSKFPWPAAGNNENALCQTICLASAHNGQFDEAYLLRTYDHKYDPDFSPPWVRTYNEGAEDLEIWQVARATTAAPFYFDMLFASLSAERGMKGFKDGGIRENNPSYAAYSEYASKYGDEVNPSLLLSIGAGRADSSAAAFRSVWPGPFRTIPAVQRYSERFSVFGNLLIKATEGESEHKKMRLIARGEHGWYKRLSVEVGMEDMKIDEWEAGYNIAVEKILAGGRTTTKIELATQLYLGRDHVETLDGVKEYQPPKIMLQQIAEKLVRTRRAREFEAMTKGGEKREKWEAYMGKHLPGEQELFDKYLAQWDYAMLGRK